MIPGKELPRAYSAQMKLFRFERQESEAGQQIESFNNGKEGWETNFLVKIKHKNRGVSLNGAKASNATPEDVQNRFREQFARYIKLRDEDRLTPPWRKYGEKHTEDIAKLQLRKTS